MSSFHEPTISPSEQVRPTVAEINLSRLTENYRAIKRHVGRAKVLVTLKANAYGHGLLRVAQHMVSLDADYLGVAVLEEGILLRQAGIDIPILVLGGILGDQIPAFIKHNLTITASSVEKLHQIDKAASGLGRRARIHLKIDTGMERIGIHYYSATPLLDAAQETTHCDIEGIYSHFANSDALELSSAREQLRRFEGVLSYFDLHGFDIPMRHIANSGAILQLPDAHLDMVRAGILLYGYYPSTNVKRAVLVRPALSWKSRVVYFKVVQPGHPVSYGSTWQSDKLTRIVTIPVGYGDGYFRAISNKGEVIIRGNRYPIVGRICMDQLMVDIGWETAYNNDEVILLGEPAGPPPQSSITIEEIANWAGTIPYEILTNINTRVPRIYIDQSA